MFDIVGKKWIWLLLSVVLIVPGLVFLFLGGLKPGIDFTGGSELELRITQAENIIPALEEQAKVQNLELRSVVPAEDDRYLLRFKSLTQAEATEYEERLDSGLGNVEPVSFISVGPSVSGDISWQTVLAGIGMPLRLFGVNITESNISQAIGGVFWASLIIALYIAYAFRGIPKPYSPFAFGLSTIIGLIHDVLVVLGVFALLGYFFEVEIDTSFVTALLTIIGFSVHDTIVVFDRVRENLDRHRDLNFNQVVNISVMETLGRSISTSLTVVLVLASMFLLGGESIRWFVLALLVGVISGTYSSIFNASVVLAMWENWRTQSKKTTSAKSKSSKKAQPAVA